MRFIMKLKLTPEEIEKNRRILNVMKADRGYLPQLGEMLLNAFDDIETLKAHLGDTIRIR